MIRKGKNHDGLPYCHPYYDVEDWRVIRRQIERDGFEEDIFLPTDADRPVYGLNIAFGWPLPAGLKTPYENLRRDLTTLGTEIYVYPYEQTHVTVMTILNFKEQRSPGEGIEEAKAMIPRIISLVSQEIFRDSKNKFKAFAIDVGPPVLSRRAAFLPILNPTGEVARLRARLAPCLERTLSLKVEYPPTLIHSTILRFMKRPLDPGGFLNRFESIAAGHRIGDAVINEILLTTETKPYMRDGEKLFHFRLES